MKILIVKVSALGDVIHTLPVLQYIHNRYPAAEIDWLLEEGFAPVLDGHPLIHDVIRLRTRHWRQMSLPKMLTAVWQFIRQLRRKRYDMVFDLQGNSKSGLFTLLCRGREKYGFDRHQVREWPNLLATNHHIGINEADRHVARRALAVVRAALPGGGDVSSAGPLHVLPQARQHVEEQLRHYNLTDDKLIVLNYGTTWKTKLWDLHYWQQLAQRIVAGATAVPILTWGNDVEHQAAISIARAVDEQVSETGSSRAIVWPRGSLPQLVALLSRVDLVVGGDTGPIHIAAAVGTPTVSLFRVTDAERNGPIGVNHRRLQSSMPCSPCLLKECAKDEQCARSISVDTVYEALCELLNDGCVQTDSDRVRKENHASDNKQTT